jgi:hypothetical protein
MAWRWMAWRWMARRLGRTGIRRRGAWTGPCKRCRLGPGLGLGLARPVYSPSRGLDPLGVASCACERLLVNALKSAAEHKPPGM